MHRHAIATSVIAASALAVLGAGSGSAQEPGEEARVVVAGDWIRVDTIADSATAARPVAGRFLSADSGWIYLDPHGRQSYLAVSRTSLRSLEARTVKRHAATGLLTGSLIGAVAGALLSLDPCDCDLEPSVGLTGIVMVFFGGAGGVLGAIVGATIREETWAPTQVPAPPPP